MRVLLHLPEYLRSAPVRGVSEETDVYLKLLGDTEVAVNLAKNERNGNVPVPSSPEDEYVREVLEEPQVGVGGVGLDDLQPLRSPIASELGQTLTMQ